MTGNRPKSSRLRTGIRWLLEGLALLLLLLLLQLWQTRDAVTGAAPPLTGLRTDGEQFHLAGRERRPLLLYFWATWCPVCGLTSGNIDALSRDHEVIGIAMQSGDAAELKPYLDEKGWRFPVIADPHGEIARDWGVRGVPTMFVLDADNRIRHVTTGYSSRPGLALRLWLAAGNSDR